MKNSLLVAALILLLFACRKKEEHQNFFTYQGEMQLTPNAYYGVEVDGIELTISNFTYDYTTNEFSGSGSGVNFVRLKSDSTGKLPVGTFHSYENWGDTTYSFLGIALINVDTLYSGHYDELEIVSGTINISESSDGYLIEYEIVLENSEIIEGDYEGEVMKN